MPAGLWFGFLKSDTVTQGGSISLGINIIQNRNSTKQNNGNQIIGDGIRFIPTVQMANLDPDFSDQWSIDANNFTGPQF